MNKQEWIKPYRDVVEQQFRLDAAAKEEAETFFTRLGQLAATCNDQGTFATTFMQSPLYQEYTNLFQKFQKFALTSSGETTTEAASSMKKEAAASAAGEYAKSTARRELNTAISHMLPDEVNRIRWAGARALPVIGPVIQWIDNLRWVRRMLDR